MKERVLRDLQEDGARLYEPQHLDWLTTLMFSHEVSLLLRVADPRSGDTCQVQISALHGMEQLALWQHGG